jgi:hypothetical protein
VICEILCDLRHAEALPENSEFSVGVGAIAALALPGTPLLILIGLVAVPLEQELAEVWDRDPGCSVIMICPEPDPELESRVSLDVAPLLLPLLLETRSIHTMSRFVTSAAMARSHAPSGVVSTPRSFFMVACGRLPPEAPKRALRMIMPAAKTQ